MQKTSNNIKRFSVMSYLHRLLSVVGDIAIVIGLSEPLLLIVGIVSLVGANLIMKTYLKNEKEEDRKEIKGFFKRQGWAIFLCSTVILAPVGITIKNGGSEKFDYYKKNFSVDNFKSSFRRRDELDIKNFLDLDTEYSID